MDVANYYVSRPLVANAYIYITLQTKGELHLDRARHIYTRTRRKERTKGEIMKKLFVLSLMLGTMVFVVPSVEARERSTSVGIAPQIIIQPRRTRRGWNRRMRTVVTTRTRWVGRYRYRETFRTTYFANGRTRTVLINRVRLGGRRGFRNF